MKSKFKRGGVVSDLVSGTGGLIFTVVIILVLVATLLGANLLTANSAEKNSSDRMMGNFTQGIDNVSSKIPTVLLIGAVVLLIGVPLILYAQAKKSGLMGGSGGGSL
jgi:ACR3 family arsenite efflux pump ArsB